MISDFVRYRKLVVAKYPDLDLQHADIISCILKHLHDDCKKYLLLHGSLTTLEQPRKRFCCFWCGPAG